MGANQVGYGFGQGGVNNAKNPLQLADNEASQLQNAELIPDEDVGGEGSLSKRLGLSTLNGSALAGAAYGLTVMPLETTYTRYLYASLKTADSDRWLRTTDGTSWTATSAPPLAATDSRLHVEDTFAVSDRMASFAGRMFYPGDDYTVSAGTNSGGTNPPIISWDGSNGFTVMRVPPGPSSNGNAPFGINDMIVANGKIYFSVHDPASTAAAADAKGRVFSLDPTTGLCQQIALAFGASPFQAGGFPVSLAFYNGQLWVAMCEDTLANNSTAKVVRCYPDIDTSWTEDVTNLQHDLLSICAHGGDLWVSTTNISGSAAARIYRRSASTGTWASSYNTGNTGSNTQLIKSLVSFNDELYAVEIIDDASDSCHIKKFDGSSWTTDRDVDNLDGWNSGLQPAQAFVWQNALYMLFRSTDNSATDGFILRKSGGTWTKVATDNFGGYLGELIIRS